jgi:hypothetical protein
MNCKCMACPTQVESGNESLNRIAVLLKGTILRQESFFAAAKMIGPLCPECLKRWERTVPR